MKSKLQPWFLAIFVAFLTRAAVAEQATFLLHWSHQSQFAGYYVAKEKGFYRKRGVDVVIKRGGYDVDMRACLAESRPVFCTTMLFTALEKRNEGVPLVHLAQVVNRANFTLVAWRKEGIFKPEDLQGRRVSLWLKEYEAPYDGFFKRYNLQPVKEPQFFTVNLFLRRRMDMRHGVDACSAMYYNEYHTIQQCGVDPEELTVFEMWKHGFDFPEDGIYCMEQTFANQPGLCRDIAEASLEGWIYTRDHQEETLDIVMDYVRRSHVPTNRAHMKWMLEKILISIFPGTGDKWQFGALAPERYDNAVRLLHDQGLIRNAPAFNEFHRVVVTGKLQDDGGPAAPRAGVSATGSLLGLGQGSVAAERDGHLITNQLRKVENNAH